MANFSITPAAVKPSEGILSSLKRGISGVAINAGAPVYIDKEDNRKIKLASAAGGVADGIAVTTSGNGQPCLYAVEDSDFDLGTSIGSGQVVVLSETPGALCPDVDVDSGRKVILGVGKGGTKINLKIVSGGTL